MSAWYAASSARKISVPPPAWMRAMSLWMRARCLAGVMLHDARRLRVERDDLEEIVGGERVGGRLRGLLRHLERQAGHRAGAIDDERHRDLRLVAPLLGVHPHGEDPLDRRVVPAAEAVAVLAAREEEAAAEVAHVLLDRVLLRERDALGGRVAEDDEVVALELAQARRQLAGRACRRRAAAR